MNATRLPITDSPSWLKRLRYTPVSDLLRGRITGRLSVWYLIHAANLPQPLTQLIRSVIRQTRLWHREKIDVARELIAHFQDGLEAGADPQQLVKSFGDARSAALLIRRAKTRNRPLWWRCSRRAVQSIALLLLALLVTYALLALRFFAGSPTITHDYLAELNRTATKTPQSQRAWPLYRQALIGLPSILDLIPDAPPQDVVHPAGIMPGDPHWPVFEQYVIQHADRIDLMRQAAAMPVLGYEATPTISPEDQPLWPHVTGGESNINAGLLGVLLPHLGELRSIAMILVVDAHRAASESDSQRVIENFNAIGGIVRQAREIPVIVGDLVAIAIFQMMRERLGHLLAHQPELFSDAQLQQLAHWLAGFDDSVVQVRIGSERSMFYDLVQRMYTDDGTGDGRLTPEGVRLLQSINFIGGGDVLDEFMLATGPVFQVAGLGRRELVQEYDRLLNEAEVAAQKQFWQRGEFALERKIEQWSESSIDRWRYYMLWAFMPAVEKAASQQHYARTGRDATLAAIALELFRRRHGRWPSSLQDVVPALLPKMPIDPHDGAFLRYGLTPAGPMLYSVGSDRNDDGGRAAGSTSIGKPDDRAAMRWIPAGRSEPVPDGDWVLWRSAPE